MEVQIISSEIIKPATLPDMPHNDQNTYKISLLDMCTPQTYTSLILFYSMKETQAHFNKEDAIAKLKVSLSQTLAKFPMLGGKIKGDLIDCSNIEENKIGALFLEAKVKVSMVDFLKTPNLHLLPQFLPFPLVSNETLETTMQVTIQLNFFSCGGIAIGFSFFHKIIDATTMSAFIKSWAASNLNNNHEGESNKLVCGDYHLASSLFPPRELIHDHYNFMSPKCPFIAQEKNSTTNRFVFDAMAISNLKARAKSNTVLNPTSVEAVSCFIWKHAMEASKSCRSLEGVAQDQDSKWSSALIHVVNMRRKMQPALPDHTVGNFLWRTPTYYELEETISNNNRSAISLADLVSILRRSLSGIDNDFIQKLIGEDGFETISSSLEKLNELRAKSSESYFFTSWCNMGFKEVDFGWGKPVWNANGSKVCDSIMRNSVVLMDTTMGKGIEAWILLDDEIMSLLQNDSEFLQFASPNPSITLPA